MRSVALALIAATAAACSGSGGGGEPIAPTGTTPIGDDPIARFDAALERALAALDRAEDGVTPGPRLDPAVRVRIPLTRDPGAYMPQVSVTYYHELACKHCAALRARIASFPADDVHLVLVPRVILVHRAKSMAAHLVECAAGRLGHDLTAALWAGAFDTGDYASATLLRIAADAGVDPAGLVGQIETGDCLAEILADHVLALRAGVRGTPTFFVNGIPIEGLPDEMGAEVKREHARVNAALAAGETLSAYHAAWQSTARVP